MQEFHFWQRLLPLFGVGLKVRRTGTGEGGVCWLSNRERPKQLPPPPLPPPLSPPRLSCLRGSAYSNCAQSVVVVVGQYKPSASVRTEEEEEGGGGDSTVVN